MPPVWRGVLHPELDRVAFSLEGGRHRRSGPRPRRLVARPLQDRRVLRRLPGRPVSWGEAEPEVLSWLEREDLTPDEWYMWQIRVERQVEIRLAGL
ncbi:MAG: hypothetical protein R3F20_10325 [Planctomycetota bacterium]